MSWTDFFRSRYVRSLEKELAEIRERHVQEIERIKTVHAEELSRAITEANRGWAEADRLRQFLVPGLAQSTRVEPETPSDKKAPEAPRHGGTLFQQMAAASYEEQKRVHEEAKRLEKMAHQFPTPQKQETPPAVPKEN